ncbi:MAG: phosphoribosylpyrophosphate synthetase [Ferruginibacter sp.]
MYTYDTVVEAIDGLKARGYEIDLNLAFDKLICNKKGVSLNPSEFEITEVYRFEGDTNPSDEDVVYAVESKDGKTKGVLTEAFGMYADVASDEMLKKLTMHSRNQQS